MISNNPVPAVCNYGSSAVYRCEPNAEQLRSGVVPLDSLPAAWWNCLWYDTNRAVNCARYAIGVLIDEVNTVLQQAGVCVNPVAVDQLYQSIDKMKTIIGNATVAGSVKSSSCPGEVSIDANGIMTANCVGNANNLTTTAHTIVGAINELKSTYDCCVSDINGCLTSLQNAKAPVNHASATTDYGVGTASAYGHLKVSDTYDSLVGCACDGIAASQLALHCTYVTAMQSSVTLGDTAACPLGAAQAGTALTAARSDHVHPLPTWVRCGSMLRYYTVTCSSSCPVYKTTVSGQQRICNNTDHSVLILSACCSVFFIGCKQSVGFTCSQYAAYVSVF